MRNRNATIAILLAGVWACGGTPQSSEAPPQPDPADQPQATSSQPGTARSGPGAGTMPQVGLTMMFEVKDFDRWKAEYDNHAGAVRSASVVASVVLTEKNKRNSVMVHWMGTDKAKMEALFNSPALHKAMIGAGVIDKPTTIWTRHADLDPPTPSEGKMIAGVAAAYRVKDFAQWLSVFQSGQNALAQAGIIAHIVAHDIRDKRSVYLILGGTDATKLEALVNSPEAAEAARRGGVLGTPRIKFFDVVD